MLRARVEQFLAQCAGLKGPKRYGFIFLLGAFTTLALPPAYFFPAIFFTLPTFLWCLDGAQTKKQAFWSGWFFGFGMFLLGLYWICFSLFVHIEDWWWLVPVAVTGIPAALAVFNAALPALLLHMADKRGWQKVLLFVALWGIFEWLRGLLFTGFPWYLAGYVWAGYIHVIQSAALFGIYGLSLITVLVAALPYLKQKRSCGIALVLLLSLWGYGFARLPAEPVETHPDIALRIVQPDIRQKDKWVQYLRRQNFMTHVELSNRPDKRTYKKRLIIWPEVALTFDLWSEPMALERLARTIQDKDILLVGSHYQTPFDPARRRADYYNSILALGPGLKLLGHYDKFHLVPFGEYFPLGEYLPYYSIVSEDIGFSMGNGPHTVKLQDLPPFSPLICYEVIFPRAVADPLNRPQWILNVTNDAWFGKSAGPHQHFAQARVRAIEEGLPLVRSANTGISAVVDPYGRVIEKLGLEQRGIIDSGLPRALPPTLYSRIGNLLFFITCGLFLGFGGFNYRKT